MIKDYEKDREDFIIFQSNLLPGDIISVDKSYNYYHFLYILDGNGRIKINHKNKLEFVKFMKCELMRSKGPCSACNGKYVLKNLDNDKLYKECGFMIIFDKIKSYEFITEEEFSI